MQWVFFVSVCQWVFLLLIHKAQVTHSGGCSFSALWPSASNGWFAIALRRPVQCKTCDLLSWQVRHWPPVILYVHPNVPPYCTTCSSAKFRICQYLGIVLSVRGMCVQVSFTWGPLFRLKLATVRSQTKHSTSRPSCHNGSGIIWPYWECSLEEATRKKILSSNCIIENSLQITWFISDMSWCHDMNF